MPVASTGSVEEWVPLSKLFQAMLVQWSGGAGEMPFVQKLDELRNAAEGEGDFLRGRGIASEDPVGRALLGWIEGP